MADPDYWFRIISEIELHLSLRKIADVAGVSHQSIWRYKTRESEPKHSVGEMIKALHDCICNGNDRKLGVFSEPEPPG